MNKFAFALAAVATATATNFAALSPAMAQEPASVTIDTAGYDLNSDAGYTALAGRIARASSAVCGPVDMRNLDMMPAVTACRETAQADGIAQLDRLAGGGRVSVAASR